MTNERRLLAQLASDLFSDPAPTGENAPWPSTLWRQVEEVGLPLLGTPAERGGSGGSFADLAIVLLEAGRRAVPLPLAENALAGWLLAEAEITIPDGPLVVGFTGATVGNQRGSLHEGETSDGLGWARNAEHVVMLTQEGGSARLTVLPRDAISVSQGANVAGEPRDRVTQTGSPVVTVSVAAELVDRTRHRDALSRSLLMVGAASRVLSMTLEHAEQRHQFGRSINRFQAVQHQLAELASEVELARAMANAATSRTEAKDDLSPAIAAARVQASRAASVAIRVGHQVHAAMGFTEEHQLHHLSRRLMAWTGEAGGEVVWARRLGQFTISQGSGALWNVLTKAQAGDPVAP